MFSVRDRELSVLLCHGDAHTFSCAKGVRAHNTHTHSDMYNCVVLIEGTARDTFYTRALRSDIYISTSGNTRINV